jgi:hypothetical protein
MRPIHFITAVSAAAYQCTCLPLQPPPSDVSAILAGPFDEYWSALVRSNLKQFHENLSAGKWMDNEKLITQDYYWNYDGQTFTGPKDAIAALGYVAEGPLRGLKANDIYNIVDGNRGAILLQISGKQAEEFAGLPLQSHGLFNVKEAELLVFDGEALAHTSTVMTPIALMKEQMKGVIEAPPQSTISLKNNSQTSSAFRQHLRQTMARLHLNVNQGNASENGQFAVEDVEVEVDNRLSRGRDAFVNLVAACEAGQGAFPHKIYHDAEIMVDGRQGAIEYIWQSHQARPYPGIPFNNGTTVKVRGMLFMEFDEEGLITRATDVYDEGVIVATLSGNAGYLYP